MREHIHRIIEEAARPGGPPGIDGSDDLARRLAGETIRLARLAATTHMVLAARAAAAQAPPAPEPARGPSR